MSVKKKVVMTGTLGTVLPEGLKLYESVLKSEVPDAEVEFLFDGPVPEDEFIARAKGATIMVNQFHKMTDSIYKALLPELKAFVASGIGTNAADVPVATANGIMVCNVPDYCQDEVASHAAALILACQRGLPALYRWIGDGKWGGGFNAMKPKKRFAGSTLGLYGFGRIPRDVTRMLSGFSLNIIAHDPYVPEEVFKQAGVTPVSFDQLIEESDYISLHAPLTETNQEIFNADVFKRMKPSATFVNTARGGLVDAQALYDALKNNEICMAALDVFTVEPPVGIELEITKLPNALVTPHVAYYSEDALTDLLVKGAQEAARILKGEMPKNLVNPEVLK